MYKKKSRTYQPCKECEHWFKPRFIEKYCSDECRAIVRSRRQKEKKAKSLITGMINGRPLWEDQFLRYKKRADNKGLDFELTKDYFKDNWGNPCYYCGDTILRIGIDRIDSSKGYIPSNIVICCGGCNLMKRSMTKQVFIEQCKKIAKKH